MKRIRGSAENPSFLRQEAEGNIWNHLRRHSRIVRFCAALAVTAGFVGNQHENTAVAVGPIIPLAAAATAHGVRTRRKCTREVDAYAVNVGQGHDRLSRHKRIFTETLEVRDGELREGDEYDHIATLTDSQAPSIKYPEPFIVLPSMALGLVGNVIANQSYAEGAESTVYGLEAILAGGITIAFGASSATIRMRSYNHQLDNIEGPSAISVGQS